MSDTIIRVENLGKKFRRGARPAYGRFSEFLVNGAREGVRWARDRALSVFSRTSGMAQELREHEFWALKDVSFEVKRGEVLGIIGRNGAGKSTLLKLLSRITRPTTGEIRLRGRVGSLLEVGTGFHPELTGRENIFLNGTILGMRRTEIARKFDEIVAFAEIEQFLDTPVKHYSSGMYMRLAFAVAAHLETEILLVDEVLAVGDAEFQEKCLGKMGEVASAGRTVLFVSHNLGAIRQLCSRSILLEAGHIAMQGDARSIVAGYLAVGEQTQGCREWDPGAASAGVDDFRVFAVRILDGRQLLVGEVGIMDPFIVEIEYEIANEITGCRIGFGIATSDGVRVFGSFDSDCEDFRGRRSPGRYVSRCHVPGHLLNSGEYLLSLEADQPNRRYLLVQENILLLRIRNTGAAGSSIRSHRKGIIWPQFDWEVRPASPVAAD